jgi:hypothetical protein
VVGAVHTHPVAEQLFVGGCCAGRVARLSKRMGEPTTGGQGFGVVGAVHTHPLGEQSFVGGCRADRLARLA